MSADVLSSSLTALQDVLDTMPAVRAMQIRLDGYADGVLRITAPLVANVNDKGNAFGGSLASVLTLSGWALVSLRLALAGHPAEVYVADSQLRYLAPVYEDLHAHAQAADTASWETFLATFAQRGKARISIVATQPGADGRAAAEFTGRFVAFPKG
ncbi:YiiD C-terminal domain-containing protein [Stenotrophomonas sp. 24(2023)]|uniref:YiiD C-terminal domain-containing protein n=1 Tax=Stenotrophomonas sp. 24(2023) TaxID=3068324 RepID=UPI0027E02602|nr:YiiD C-terminal domain-containing protein [Stenotrophomonas sp. 24(2023)]WMJ71211.1 YiiD C-terminal domain-containing protein [Stenotrophomonas sp. 24(2023)]